MMKKVISEQFKKENRLHFFSKAQPFPSEKTVI